MDIINFNCEIAVKEIRIIPLGAKVEVSAVGTRLGATNPSSFHIEAFVNNRREPHSTTFQRICRYGYSLIAILLGLLLV